MATVNQVYALLQSVNTKTDTVLANQVIIIDKLNALGETPPAGWGAAPWGERWGQ